jgi:hypothetical protein
LRRAGDQHHDDNHDMLMSYTDDPSASVLGQDTGLSFPMLVNNDTETSVGNEVVGVLQALSVTSFWYL